MLRLLWYLIVGYDWRDSTPSKFPMVLNFGSTSVYLHKKWCFQNALYENGQATIMWYNKDGGHYIIEAQCDQIEFESQLMRLK